MSVAHNEGTTNTGIVNAPTVTLPGCTQTLTRRAALGTDTVTLGAGCLSAAQLNAGPTLTYAVSHALGSATPANVALDGIRLGVSYTVNGVSGTASVTLGGFKTGTGANIPNDAAITSVRLRVTHGEDDPTVTSTPTVTITPAGGSACTAVPLAEHASLTEDPSPSYDVTSCLNSPAQINNGVSLTYSVARCGGCTGSTVARLDGAQLDVTYAPNPRLPWDPTNPNANPSVPGACRRDGDPFWTDGVQWVFGGDSHLNILSGQMELCDKPSPVQADPSQNKQEIVLYGVKGATPVSGTFGAATATNTAAPPDTGFDSTGVNGPNAARAIDGTSAATGTAFTTGTRSLTLSGFSGSLGQIPADATNISVSLTVAHNEGNSSTLRSLVNAPAISITPGGSSTTCTALAVTTSTANNTTPVSQTFADVKTGCLDTPAKINGATLRYAVTHSATAGTASPALDGITLTVTYTPAGGAGGLNPESLCATQAPYYSLDDHSPAANGACALVRVTKPTGTPSATDVRKVTFWGTVYAPDAAFDLPVDVMTVPVFNRGVVARMLMLGYHVANSTQIPFTTVPLTGDSQNNREATFNATVNGATKVTAHVTFCDVGCPNGLQPLNGVSPVVVDSWVVNR